MQNLTQKLRVGAAFVVAVALTATAVSVSNPQNASATPMGGCYDMEFIWARGSGSPMNAPEYKEFKRRIEQQTASAGFNGVVNFYELGTAPGGYPAQKVFEMTPEGIGVMLGAKLSAGSEFAYGDSVRRGADELQNYIRERLAACPRTYFALGGYSQGAQVIGDALVKLPKEIDAQVLYSVLYGDPKLYLPEGDGVNPPACRGEGLSEYRAHVPKCKTSEGLLGGRKPYVQPFQAGKVATYCNAQDMICGSTENLLLWGGHTTYIQNGLILDGAHKIMAAAREALPALFLPDFVSHSPNALTPGQDVAILLDTTGSMDQQLGEFDTAIKDIKRLVRQVLASGGRVALLEYRDTDSAFGASAPSRILCDFTACTSPEAIDELLAGLTAEGGGDYDESMLHGVQNALQNTQWREGAQKALVIFTDAGFHEPDPTNGWTMADAQRVSIALNPVNIYIAKLFPGHSGDAVSYHYTQLEQLKELAELTTGEATAGGAGSKSFAQMLDDVAKRPMARLASTAYHAELGRQIVFDATGSTGVSAELAYADWDLDGDGRFEVSGSGLGLASLRHAHTYTNAGSGYMQVRVVDKNGLSKTASATYAVSDKVEFSKPYMQVELTVEKKSDEDGAEYAELKWKMPEAVNSYRLYVNGMPLGQFPWDATSAKIYDLDFTRDNYVQLKVVAHAQLHDSEGVWLYAENAADDEFDWSEALEAIKPEEPKPEIPAAPSEPEVPTEPETNESPNPNPASPEPGSSGTAAPDLAANYPTSNEKPGRWHPSRPAGDSPRIVLDGTNSREAAPVAEPPIEVPDASRLAATKLKMGFWHAWVVISVWVLLVLAVFWWLVAAKRRKDKEKQA
jgi:hypothetical protein